MAEFPARALLALLRHSVESAGDVELQLLELHLHRGQLEIVLPAGQQRGVFLLDSVDAFVQSLSGDDFTESFLQLLMRFLFYTVAEKIVSHGRRIVLKLREDDYGRKILPGVYGIEMSERIARTESFSHPHLRDASRGPRKTDLRIRVLTSHLTKAF